MANKELNKEKILAFMKLSDWSGLARAFAEGDIKWHAAEWADLFETMRHQSDKYHKQIFETLAKDLLECVPDAHMPVQENIKYVLERYRKACYPLAKI